MCVCVCVFWTSKVHGKSIFSLLEKLLVASRIDCIFFSLPVFIPELILNQTENVYECLCMFAKHKIATY